LAQFVGTVHQIFAMLLGNVKEKIPPIH